MWIRLSEHTLLEWIMTYKYTGIFLALALGILGIPIPDEFLLTFIGYSIWRHQLLFSYSLLVAVLGSLTAMTISYVIGRYVGQPVLEKIGPKVGLHLKRLEQVEEFFRKYGAVTIVFGYFIPGVRHVTAIFSGMSRLSLVKFYTYATIGSTFWISTFIMLGKTFGPEWKRIASWVRHITVVWGLPILLIVIVVMILFVLRKNHTKK